MRKIAGLLLLSVMVIAGERVCFFFSPEKKVEIEGKVKDIEENHRFCMDRHFVMMSIKDKRGKVFKVYISPPWFFTQRPEIGEDVKIKGAYCEEDKKTIIAEWIYFRGEKIFLRDERGFPLWSRKMRGRGNSRRMPWRKWKRK